MIQKILIAEDDDAMRSMLVDYLEDIGYDIIEAENGEIAWSLWNKEKSDLLVTDINMPHLNGIELLKNIKSVDSSFPVIVVTGVTIDKAQDEAIAHGADFFLGKPFKMKELLEKIKILNER
jgi:DNA-binding response OmpR family regulator